MGIVFTGMFGLGIVLFSRIETDQHLPHILFGDMLGVTWGDLIETAIIAGGTLLVVFTKRRDFLLYAFDPQHARAIGLPVRLLHYGLLAMLSLTIVASLKAVGIILVVAMLIAPGRMKAARQPKRSVSAPATSPAEATPMLPKIPLMPSALPCRTALPTSQAMPTG